MVGLTPSQFWKDEYRYRIGLFLYKIKNKSNFTLSKGNKSVKLLLSLNQYNSLKEAFDKGDSTALNNFVFADQKNNQYKGTGRFEKTSEFGGGGGSTDKHSTFESAQCVYNAALMIPTTGYKKYKFTIEKLQAAFRSTDTKVSESRFKSIKDLSELWKISSELGAVYLKSKFPKYFGSGYQHHRASSELVEHINKQFNKINRIEKVFEQINKWSPADIWMVDRHYIKDFKKELKTTENFIQLNKLLEKSIKEKKLLGVSLKQMKRSTTLLWRNYSPFTTGIAQPSFKFKSFSLGLVSFTNSKNTHLFYEGGEFLFRYKDGYFIGEVISKNSREGSVSGQNGPKSTIGKYAKDYLGKATTSGSNVLTIILDSPASDGYTTLMDNFYENYKLCIENTGDADYKDKPSFLAAVEDKLYKNDKEWFVSKYIGTEIMSLISQATEENKNKFTTSVLTYATAQSELSAPYIIIK